MAERSPLSSFVQCSGCGRELSNDTVVCPFCGTTLAAADHEPAGLPDEEPSEEPLPVTAVDSAQPIERTRFALAGTVGLLAALILGYAWYLLAVQAEREYALVALVIGLIAGWVVALVSGGSLAIPYRILGAILAAGSVAFGQFLIYARPQSPFYFEFSATLLLIYGIALLEGWQAPQIAARRGLLRIGLIDDNNQGLLLGVSLVLLAALIGAGFIGGILVGPPAVQAKIHATRAVTLLEKGDLDQAGAELQSALEDYEAYADGHFFLGLLQMNEFALDSAGDHFDRALEIGLDGKRYAEAHFQLGLIGWYWDDTHGAQEHLSMAIDGGYEDGDAYLIRGMLLVEGGEPEAGAADLNQALSLGLGPDDTAWAREVLQEIEAGD